MQPTWIPECKWAITNKLLQQPNLLSFYAPLLHITIPPLFFCLYSPPLSHLEAIVFQPNTFGSFSPVQQGAYHCAGTEKSLQHCSYSTGWWWWHYYCNQHRTVSMACLVRIGMTMLLGIVGLWYTSYSFVAYFTCYFWKMKDARMVIYVSLGGRHRMRADLNTATMAHGHRSAL